MSLLDEATELVAQVGPRCGIARLKKVDPKLYEELEEALVSDLPSTAIAKALQARGSTLTYHTVGRHRAGSCSCH